MTLHQVVVKPVGSRCNLACRYCYYRPHLVPATTTASMSHALLERTIASALRGHPGPAVGFVWHGGEPTLLGRDFYATAVALQARYAPPGVQVQNSLQTNGTLLEPAFARFLAEHHFAVGVSLDGPPHLHDACRPDRGGRPTAARVLEGLRILAEAGVEPSLLATVNRVTAEAPEEVYDFLVGEAGGRYLQFIPVVDRPDRSIGPDGVGPGAFGEFLQRVFERWLDGDVGRVFVQRFDATLALMRGLPAPVCTLAETCGAVPVVACDGSVYACDHYVDEAHRLGSLDERSLVELVQTPAQRAFGRAKGRRASVGCGDCPWWERCRGGCPANRNDRGEPRLCAGYRRFYAHSAPVFDAMSRALDHGRAPAEVMRWVDLERGRRTAAQLGLARHAPCPCFSGQKFRRCHGRA